MPADLVTFQRYLKDWGVLITDSLQSAIEIVQRSSAIQFIVKTSNKAVDVVSGSTSLKGRERFRVVEGLVTATGSLEGVDNSRMKIRNDKPPKAHRSLAGVRRS
ncbi:hypothetical protein E4U52_007070 [Claviceps spartinae]|nr:hypothetical protein E4U52_007070 [Claviceps spartinae]